MARVANTIGGREGGLGRRRDEQEGGGRRLRRDRAVRPRLPRQGLGEYRSALRSLEFTEFTDRVRTAGSGA